MVKIEKKLLYLYLLEMAPKLEAMHKNFSLNYLNN